MFDKNEIDREAWSTQQSFGPHINANTDHQIFLDKNVEVSDGKLKLWLKNEPGCYDTWRFCNDSCERQCRASFLDSLCSDSMRCTQNGDHCLCIVQKHYNYTGGMLVSKEKFMYGVFEIRCKIPKDCQTAFWLFGECCEEIDIFEFLGCEEDNPSITIHECPSTRCNEKNLMCGKSYKNLKKALPTDFSEDFHTWKLDWQREKLTIYVDDREIFSCNRNGMGACIYDTFRLSNGSCTIGTHTHFPNKPMNLILNIATNVNDCTPPVPAAFEVDWIKISGY